MAFITVTKDNFESEVMRSEKTVLLDFWAPWCAPCRMLSPVIEKLGEKHADTVLVGKINVDAEPEMALMFGATVIPMIVVVKNGQIVNRGRGYMSLEQIEELLG